MRAPQATAVAELEKGNAAHRAGLLVELAEFFGRLTKRRLLSKRTSQGTGFGFLVRWGSQVDLGTFLAEVQFLVLPALELGDMKRGRFFALLAFHGNSPTQER
jgi:hypothetical protein